MSSMAASAASVPAATLSNASARAAASTACQTPNRTRMAATLRPQARARTASSTPSQTPYSCIPASHLPDCQIALDVRYRINDHRDYRDYYDRLHQLADHG